MLKLFLMQDDILQFMKWVDSAVPPEVSVPYTQSVSQKKCKP